MHILYAVNSRHNRLYAGRYSLANRFQTYGQHAFIYDLVKVALASGIRMTVAVEGYDTFPLIRPLAGHASVIDAATSTGWPDVDLIMVDEPSDWLIETLPEKVPCICIVHTAAAEYSPRVKERCRWFWCMTEHALTRQGARIAQEKLLLQHQGVDLDRFRPASAFHDGRHPAEVLLCSRLDRESGLIVEVVDRLLYTGCHVTLVGSGDNFWEVSDRFGERIVIINHIPCHSIHRFIVRFDAVISAGRGVMEALACGLPGLCAGYEYSGPVSLENISRQLEVNLTGRGRGRSLSRLPEDLEATHDVPTGTWRELAEKFCCMRSSLHRVLAHVMAGERPRTPERGPIPEGPQHGVSRPTTVEDHHVVKR